MVAGEGLEASEVPWEGKGWLWFVERIRAPWERTVCRPGSQPLSETAIP